MAKKIAPQKSSKSTKKVAKPATKKIVKRAKPAPKPKTAKSKPSAKKTVTKKPVAKKAKPVAKKKALKTATPKAAKAKAPKAPEKKVAPKAVKPTKKETAKAGKKTASTKAAKNTPAQIPAPQRPTSHKSIRERLIATRNEREKLRPAAFTMDEIREIAKVAAKAEAVAKAEASKAASKKAEKIIADKLAKQVKPNHIQAASLSDILGFNPHNKEKRVDLDAASVPDRFRKYYKLLVQLRSGLTQQLDEHSEETLKHSNKDDSGDLSSYGQHDADAGTDAFDRDFALSMVASEQEALSEIDAAIQRIKNGTYGICEITHKPISKDRLLAVPFTRYSAEAQKEIERYRIRSRTQPGIFTEFGDDSQAMNLSGDDSED